MTARRDAARMSAEIRRLEGLEGAERIAYGMKLVRARRNKQITESALRVLAASPHLDRSICAALVEEYAYYNADGPRRDPSSPVRTALLEALLPIVHPDDVALLEAAITTYERIPPGFREEAGTQRAAALRALAVVDRELAAFYAGRLLFEPIGFMAVMSGEPQLTAVRVLTMLGHEPLIYAYIMRETENERDAVAEALSEGMRRLVSIPESLLVGIISRHRAGQNDMTLAGLFDLLLTHPAGRQHYNFIAEYLAETRNYGLYGYVVTALVASRQPGARDLLLGLAAHEEAPRKVGILHDALALIAGQAGIEAVLATLRGRLQG
jgi:hypothetical protein